eukprot:symbB.v1.2.022022.t1/scaffold1885.1/size149428/3
MTDRACVQKTLSCSPRTDYYQGSEETLQRDAMGSGSNRVSDVFRSLLPWFLALLLGVLTAITGLHGHDWMILYAMSVDK